MSTKFGDLECYQFSPPDILKGSGNKIQKCLLSLRPRKIPFLIWDPKFSTMKWRCRLYLEEPEKMSNIGPKLPVPSDAHKNENRDSIFIKKDHFRSQIIPKGNFSNKILSKPPRIIRYLSRQYESQESQTQEIIVITPKGN